MKKISLLIADDQILFVDLLESIIKSRTQDIDIVGTAYNGDDARDMIFQKKPDIALLDVRMPGIDGVTITNKICKELSQVKVVILTTFPDDEYVDKAMKYGASGYLLKNIPVDELITSIRSIYRGNCIVSQTVAKNLFVKTTKKTEEESRKEELTAKQKELTKYLSRREKEVYKLMLKGCSNQEIADALFIAQQTVKNHIHSIYSRIGFHNRSDIFNLEK